MRSEGGGPGEAAALENDRAGKIGFWQQRAAGYTLVWSKSVESRPSPQEPESPKTHPGRSDETDAREPEWDHLRSKLDLPAKDKTDGMEERDQSKDGPRDDEKRLLLCHRDIPLVLDVVHWD